MEESSGGRKRNREAELDDQPRHRKVAASLSGEEVNSLSRCEGSTVTRDIPCPTFNEQIKPTTAHQRPPRAGAAHESFLQVGTCGELQHLAMRGQHTSVEDTLHHHHQHQVYAQPFQSILPYSMMLQQQQQQQQRQVGNFLSEAAEAAASTSIQASQAQMLQGTSGRSSHLPRQQMQPPLAPVPNAFRSAQFSKAQDFQALSESEILQLLRHTQQPHQGISAAAADPEANLEQHQRWASSQAFATPISQAHMLQARGGRSGLLQQIQSQLGLFSATPSTSNVSISSETSQAQIIEGLLQHIQSQQELSSTAAAAPERNTPDLQILAWQQKLALLAERENTIRTSGMCDMTAPSNQGRRVASAPPSRLTSSAITLRLPDDKHQLSEYQVTVRQQLEIFEAEQEDYESNIQGRKRHVIPGQAGIRCCHCSDLPLRQRGRGAVYYPLKLSGIYQAAQNMASSHLSDCCSQIPSDVKQKLRDLRHRRDMAIGGKKYWAEAGSASGLYETEEGLRLRPSNGAAVLPFAASRREST